MNAAPSNKVVAATSAGTIAAAVGTLIVWALNTYTATAVPDGVQIAIVTILTLVFTALFGYLWPEGNPAPSAVETVKRKHLA